MESAIIPSHPGLRTVQKTNMIFGFLYHNPRRNLCPSTPAIGVLRDEFGKAIGNIECIHYSE
jgi:hypothetical protein